MKLQSHVLEFYITNVCNLACSGCNRFNNLNLSGHEDWKKHRNSYKKFSDFVEPRLICILGGEPLAHPEIVTIIKDIRSFWPYKNIKLTTNGLLLNKHEGLGKVIQDCNIRLDVNVHNHKFRRKIFNNIQTMFSEKIKLNWVSNKNGLPMHAFFHTSNNNIKHDFFLREYFYQNSLNDPYELSPHQSNPDKAWKACYSKCPTLAEGKFFKCPISHCMPVAVRQRNDIALTDKQRSLINSFPFIPCNNIDQVKKEEWYNFLYEKIPHCSLCPESFQFQKIKQKKT